MRSDRFLRAVAGIAALAFVVRIVYVVVSKRDDPLLGDEVFYAIQADSLAEGRGFNQLFGGPAAEHPPATALYLAPVWWLTGDSLFAGRLAMTLVGTAAAVAIALVARRIGGDRVGIVAGVVAALYPNLWIADGILMSEPLAVLATAIVVGLGYRLADRPTVATGAGFGLAVGAAAMTRMELLILGPLVVVPVVLKAASGPVRQRIATAVASGLAALAVIAPWGVFNSLRFEEPTFFGTSDGLLLIGTNCDDAYYGEGIGYWLLGCGFEPPPPGDQSEVSKVYRREGLEYLSEHTRRLPVVAAARVGRLWGVFAPFHTARLGQGEGRETWASIPGVVIFWLLAPMAVAGAVVLRRRRVTLVPILAPAIGATIVAASTYGAVRLRATAEVTVVVLAAVAVDALLTRRSAPSAEGGVSRG